MVSDSAVDELVGMLSAAAPEIPYDRTSAVEWLQQRLTDGGYLSKADRFTPGLYDQPTYDAVADLQSALSMSPDEFGVVDQTTFDALFAPDGATDP